MSANSRAADSSSECDDSITGVTKILQTTARQGCSPIEQECRHRVPAPESGLPRYVLYLLLLEDDTWEFIEFGGCLQELDKHIYNASYPVFIQPLFSLTRIAVRFLSNALFPHTAYTARSGICLATSYKQPCLLAIPFITACPSKHSPKHFIILLFPLSHSLFS